MFGWRLYRDDDLKDFQERVAENAAKEAYFSAMQEVLAISERVPAACDDLKPVIHSRDAGRVTWAVPRAGQVPVYVRADRDAPRELSKRWIIFVKARDFYAWWRWSGFYVWPSSSLPETNHFRPPAFGRITEYYKYKDQTHWAEGAENPSVLSEVSFRADDGLSFSDGMTRTMWLVENGAAIFPVEAVNGEAEAARMHSRVGYANMPPFPLADLFST